MQQFEKRLETFRLSKSPKPGNKSSRSINPEFPSISKFDDVTRYNSANFNVYFYKNYPYRLATPIKRSRQSGPVRYRKSVSPYKTRIDKIVKDGNLVSEIAKKQLAELAFKANLRDMTASPVICTVNAGPVGTTMNDFHKRETNAGFARNAAGGFYTR